MKQRLFFLTVLLVLTVLYQGFSLYYMVVRPTAHLLWYSGFQLYYAPAGMTAAVQERDIFGVETHAHLAGLRNGDIVTSVAVAGRESAPMRRNVDFMDFIRSLDYGEAIVLQVLREGSSQELRLPPVEPGEVRLLTRAFNYSQQIVLPFITLLAGFFIGFMKPQDNKALLACLLFVSFSSIFGSSFVLFPDWARLIGLVYWVMLQSLMIYLFMRFFLVFPEPSPLDRRLPWLKQVFFVLVIIHVLISLPTSYLNIYHSASLVPLEPLLGVYEVVYSCLLLLMLGLGVASLVLNTFKARNRDVRRRLIIILIGTLITLVPTTAFILYVYQAEATPPLWAVVLVLSSLCFFPLFFVYAVLKHRVLGIRLIIRRGLQYAMVSTGFFLAEALLAFGILFFTLKSFLLQIFPDPGIEAIAISSAGITLLLATLIRRLNYKVVPLIERHFFQDSYNAQQILTDLSWAVRHLSSRPDKLLELVTFKLSDAYYASQVAIFLRNAGSESPVVDTISGNLLFKFNPDEKGLFRCHCHRCRSPHRHERPSDISDFLQLTLPSDSFIARQLDVSVREGIKSIDVYLDDPQSWINLPKPANLDPLLLARDLEFLQFLNTRLLIPLVMERRLIGFISLGEKLSENPYTKEDRQLVMTIAEQTAIALDYSNLIHRMTEQEKMKREMEIAREVQLRLFPQTMPALKTLSYTGVCLPARGVGGDYYDFLPLEQDLMGIALGDISGKGISAALLMATLQALLRSHAALHGENIDRLIMDINRLMCDSTEASRYATFFYGLYNDRNRRFTFVNAGHNPPILLNTNGNTRRPHLHRLEATGFPIGMFKNGQYTQQSVELQPNDLLVVFTDGLSEATNPSGFEYGEERIIHLVMQQHESSVEEIRDLILEDFARFTGKLEQADDMTLVIAKAR
ncbi:MAG: SpoIIE family protein phosphatase [Acidobacteria bacterium]|nr:SpoIIE family protein phosphatase [Acidobacteriota bacterium]